MSHRIAQRSQMQTVIRNFQRSLAFTSQFTGGLRFSCDTSSSCFNHPDTPFCAALRITALRLATPRSNDTASESRADAPACYSSILGKSMERSRSHSSQCILSHKTNRNMFLKSRWEVRASSPSRTERRLRGAGTTKASGFRLLSPVSRVSTSRIGPDASACSRRRRRGADALSRGEYSIPARYPERSRRRARVSPTRS